MRLAEMPDVELARLVKAGDNDAFRLLFERYNRGVYNFVYRLVDNGEDAADIVQNAFIRMYVVLSKREIDNFSAYLYRTAKNLAFDEMRRRSRFAGADAAGLAPEDPNIYADPQRALMLGEQIQMVRRAAQGLNDKQRAALVMRELGEFDYSQIAAVLESNRNAVGALLSRARLRLKEELRLAQTQTGGWPPECETTVALLSPFIDGELTAAERASVDAHLESCSYCQEALAEMRDASHSFRMLIPVVPPASMAKAMTEKLERQAGGDGKREGKSANRRLVRRTAYFAIMAIMAVLAGTLLAGKLAIEPASQGTPAAASSSTTPTNAGSARQVVPADNTAGNGSHPATTATAPATGTPALTGNASEQPYQTAPQAPAEFSMVDFSVSPNPAWERQLIKYTAAIDGSPASVIARLTRQDGSVAATVGMARTGSSGGQETWSASAAAVSAGDYSLYFDVTGGGGRKNSFYAEMVVINANIQ